MTKLPAGAYPVVCMSCARRLDSDLVLDAVKSGSEFRCECGRVVVPAKSNAPA